MIYIQFDNVHFTRDNPNVPSDLEQMPALLNFMEQNGILMTNHHTPLISHTADDILTSLTGVYPNNLGEAVSNSYGYFNPSGTVSFASSFTYWTDKVGGTDSNYNLLTAAGQNAPAPWVPFTRAGCNVGAVATADLELENVGSDMNTVYGANSPQAAEAAANFNRRSQTLKASRSTAPQAARSARRRTEESPTCFPTSREDTRATTGSSATSTWRR